MSCSQARRGPPPGTSPSQQQICSCSSSIWPLAGTRRPNSTRSKRSTLPTTPTTCRGSHGTWQVGRQRGCRPTSPRSWVRTACLTVSGSAVSSRPRGCTMHAEPPHRADIADHDLLDDVACAAAWWAQQRVWRVTSSHTGGGVITALEEAVASRVASGAHALALPSATIALAIALEAVGVEPGSAIGVPALDWSAAAGLTRALSIAAVPLPVSPDTGLLDTGWLAHVPALTEGLAAVVAVHLHGLT